MKTLLQCQTFMQKDTINLKWKFMANITFLKGNIFNSKMQTIVNTINCVGVMGKGIALVFKLRYPEMFDKYQELCKSKMIGIGKLWLYKASDSTQWVLNFPTKFHWKYPSKIEYLEAGLQKFVDTYEEKGIASIAFPMLGTHNGGLDKNEVRQLMEKYLSKCNIDIEIYDYDPTAPDDLFENFKEKWNRIPKKDLRLVTGIRTQKQVDTIDNAVNSGGIKSMSGLIEYPGIGITTMQRCYQVVLSGYNAPSTIFE